MNIEYVIIGDTEKYDDCLVYAIGESLERAKEILNRILTNPTENDKHISNGMSNLRIEKVGKKDCWWNGHCD